MRTQRIATPNVTVLGDRNKSTRYGPAGSASLRRVASIFQPSRRSTKVTVDGTGVCAEPDKSWATTGPECYSSKGQSATSPVRASETRNTSGSVPFGHVRLLAVTEEATTTLRSSLRVWVDGSSSVGPGATLTFARSRLLSH